MASLPTASSSHAHGRAPTDALRGRVFRGSTTVASGLLTKKQLRSSAWVRLRQDVYADAALPVTHRVLISAVGLCLPDGAGFTGRSAAVLWGVPGIAAGTDPVEVVLPAGLRWHPGDGVIVRRTAARSTLLRVGRVVHQPRGHRDRSRAAREPGGRRGHP